MDKPEETVEEWADKAKRALIEAIKILGENPDKKVRAFGREEEYNPLAVRPEKAAKIIGISSSFMYELINRKQIPTGAIGGITYIRIKDLEIFLADNMRVSHKSGRKSLEYLERMQK